ncbi:hypothetical protein TanjilG_09238 [Lupinus angustifolius]|uniref:Uncharacterized protein n=1 Tax=Lupinus angustifolius TaxID=3871 RepID=A0A4P1QWS6_LUPAN|nr:hypothetical protein TanjilG_09238 [Lupinus angustifolius]
MWTNFQALEEISLIKVEAKAGQTSSQDCFSHPLQSNMRNFFGFRVAGFLVVVLHGININSYCNVECIPSTSWHCKDRETISETMVSNEQMTMTCMDNGNFRVFPFTNISSARFNDLGSLSFSFHPIFKARVIAMSPKTVGTTFPAPLNFGSFSF